jgi:copper resistance protein D
VEIGAWDVATVVIKVVTYAATLSAAGGAAFLIYNRQLVTTGLAGRIRSWLGRCVGVALLASVVRIGILSGSMGGEIADVFDRSLGQMVLQAGEGRATGLRVLGLLAITAALLSPRRLVVLALGGSIVAATSFAWVGHAWAVSRDVVPFALLSLHLVCAAFWLGALAPLWMATRNEDRAHLGVIVHAFGVAAVYLVAALVVAGGALLAVLLGAVSELWTTDYGRLISVKLGVVACLLGVAAFNKLRLTPRLKALDGTAVTDLRRSIQVEIVLGTVILLLTAALTTLVGPTRLG